MTGDCLAPRCDLLADFGQARGAKLRVERRQTGGSEGPPARERRLELGLFLPDGGSGLGRRRDVGSLDDAVERGELPVEPGERGLAGGVTLDRGERAVELRDRV